MSEPIRKGLTSPRENPSPGRQDHEVHARSDHPSRTRRLIAVPLILAAFVLFRFTDVARDAFSSLPLWLLSLGVIAIGGAGMWSALRMDEASYENDRRNAVLALHWLLSRLPLRVYRPVLVLLSGGIIVLGILGILEAAGRVG